MSDLTVRGIKIENLEKQVAELEAENANYVDRLSAYIIERGLADTERKRLEAENERLEWILDYMDTALFADVHLTDAERAWAERSAP